MYTIDLTQPRKVLEIRHLNGDTFVLSMERRGLKFAPGRHVSVGLPGDETREYSLYTGEEDENLEILVRKVEGGNVSRRLALLRPGDKVHVKGPKGGFLLSKAEPEAPLLLMATGTGIAPFRSFIRSSPGLNYTLVHGIRHLGENFGQDFCDPTRHVVCISRSGPHGDKTPEGARILSGRVTDWLGTVTLAPEAQVFLCGNQGMLQGAREILMSKGFPEEHIHLEKYF